MSRVDFYFDTKEMLRDAISESFKKEYSVVENVVSEKYGIYNGQIEDAEHITDEIIDMLLKGDTERTLKWRLSGGVPGQDVIIRIDQGTSAATASIDTEGDNVVIEIFLSPIFSGLAKIDTNAVRTRVESKIAHELSHFYAGNKRGNFDGPEEYDILVKMFVNDPDNSLTGRIGLFLKSLYFIDKNEAWAHASEMVKEIEWKIRNSGTNPITKDVLLQELRENDQFKTYSTIHSIAENKMINWPKDDINKIADFIKKYDIKFSDRVRNFFPSYIKKIKEGTEYALSKIYRSFNHILEQYGII